MAKSHDGSNHDAHIAQDLLKKQKSTIYSLRCRLCRTHLLSSDLTSSHKINPGLCGNCLYLNEEDQLPSWIQNEVELSGWTKGKIYCPKQNCNARVGGFDFVQGLLCACGVFTIPAIWIQDGKVDINIISTTDVRSSDQANGASNQQQIVPIPERKNDLSLVGKAECETERNTLLSEGNMTNIPDSRITDNVGNIPVATEVTSVARTREDRDKKTSEECRDDLNFVKTGRHPDCNRATFVSHRRDPVLLAHSRNRFGNLEVKEPKPVFLPSIKEVADHLICPICLECFYKPYQCPCSHVFCEPCLRQLYHTQRGTLKCPVCRCLVQHIEPSNELREELQKFHYMTTKARERFENSAKHKSWPLPPTDRFAVIKRRWLLLPWRDKILITFAAILLFIVYCVILYIGLIL